MQRIADNQWLVDIFVPTFEEATQQAALNGRPMLVDLFTYG